MNGLRRRVAWMAALCCAQVSWAGVVTVNVTDKSAGSAADTIIVFEPLDAAPPPSHDQAIIDQINKQYVPRVTVLRTGTEVTFPNSDHIRHQVYSFSPAKTFSLKLYAGSPPTSIVFDKAGLVVLGCNIHDRMLAFVGVVDSPYFAKLTHSGSAALTLPAGRYRLKVWNPNLTTAIAPQEIAVQAAPLTIPVVIDVAIGANAVALWPE